MARGSIFQPDGEAERLVNSPKLKVIFEELEKAYMEAGIYAEDDEIRAAAMAEIRAIRSVREQLHLAAQGKVKLPDDTGA